MKIHLLALGICATALTVFPVCLFAEGITLVENGKPIATIVTTTNPPVPVELAVAELQYHLKRMTGTELPRKTDAEPVAGPVVLVGESARTRELGLRNGDFKPREYLVKTAPGVLVLMGFDKNVRGKLRYDDALSASERVALEFPLWPDWSKWDEVGSAFAVYHFLERECGVRWYLPSAEGTFIPARSTVKADNLDVRRSPWMVYVMGKTKPVARKLYCWNRKEPLPCEDLQPMRDTELWHLRNKMWGEPFSCNHSFGSWPGRFLKDHPDWFAKGFETRIENRQPCFTNPEVLAQMIKDARDYFDGKKVPGLVAAGDVVAIVPMDSGRWCRCERCQAEMDPLPVEENPADGYNCGIASRYIHGFVAKVADAIAESHPGKRIATLAYSQYFGFPKNLTRKRDNLTVMICVQTDSWQYHPEGRRYCENEMRKWRDAAGQLYVFLYMCFPQFGEGDKFPGPIYNEYARQMRFFHELGIRGLFNDMDGRRHAYPDPKKRSEETSVSVWPNPVEDLFSWYVVVKLADDPTLDENTIYDELYANWFGRAAGAIKAFIEHAAKIYNDPGRKLPNGADWRADLEVAWGAVCLPQDMEIFKGHMAEAYRLAETPQAQAHVKLFDEAVWQCILAGRKKWEEKSALRKEYEKATPPEVRVSRCDSKARLEDLSWKGAARLGEFVLSDGGRIKKSDGTLRAQPTDVEVMHDGEFIYFRVTCHDPDTSKLVRNSVLNDTLQDREDSVGLYFDPGQTGKRRRSVIINANGFIHDSAGDNHVAWDSAAKVIVKVEPKQWVILAAVPISRLTSTPFKPGEVWGFNAYRILPTRQFSAWSPTFGDRDQLDHFGVMRFE